jgi:uncharacterized protein (DUF1697 family)
MSVHIALLRGINVGGHNKLPMKDLAAMFGEAGCGDVRTYIQSGNVVFESDTALARRIPGIITASIGDRFGLRIPVVTRGAGELAAIVSANPYVSGDADEKQLHVAFLADTPSTASIAALDEFFVRAAEIYLRLANGAGRTKLTNAYFDATLGTTSTVRNWRTTLKLLEMTRG